LEVISLKELFEVIHWCNTISETTVLPRYVVEYCSAVHTYTLSEHFDNNFENFKTMYQTYIGNLQ